MQTPKRPDSVAQPHDTRPTSESQPAQRAPMRGRTIRILAILACVLFWGAVAFYAFS
ncbi:hypothetical protein [Oceaniglobus trochenteri]|uniref:hypothetical protein n=1 Tax=Oceaniglobus trochenteri TaxID=2763260 RepID=UPI001D00105B|nr:hypothetical protein [Oceaniglobus trochenteri]